MKLKLPKPISGGLSLGDWRDLKNLIEPGIEIEEYPVLKFLTNEDMEGLFNFTKGVGFTESDNGYFSKCHLCIDIRNHLVGVGHFKELRPGEFYKHLYPENSRNAT